MPSSVRDKNSPARSRLNPIAASIQTIHGYPKKLIIYKTAASKYYWTRVYHSGRYHYKTTKTESTTDAKKFAISFYEHTLLTARGSNTSNKSKSFARLGHQFFESLKKTSSAATSHRADFSRYKNDLLPFFGEQEIDTITNAQISKFIERLRSRELSTASIKHFMVVLRKIMKYAIANDLMTVLPVFPKITGKLITTQKRDYLTIEEYDHFIKCCDSLVEKRIAVRGVPLTDEMKYLIQFMVNSFLRPSDLRVLRHRHIVKKTKDRVNWLELNHPATKTNAHPIQAMPLSTHIYRRLIEFTESNGKKIRPDDFVFFPEYKNRDTAMGVIGRLFKEIVKESRLKESSDKNITLYSLRHTAIMFRLIMGKVDTLALARNARTSQAMIDKFYAAHLTTDQVREQLHAMPSPRSTRKRKENI
jgi:site-specific recombinase XerD